MKDRNHILILGATGFIGKVFFETMQQVDGGEYHFHVLVRGDVSRISKSENITCYRGDLESFDWEQLTYTPDFIFHFARISSSGRSWGRKKASRLGRKANLRIINHLKEKENNIRLFYLSGSLMYGNSTEPITEENLLSPISFAKEYVKAERPFLEFQETDSNLKISMIRVPWVLGNGSWFEAFYKNYIYKNKEVPLYGDGQNVMSFITREDIAKCLIQLMKLDHYPVLNISYPEIIKQSDFVQLIAEYSKLEVKKIELKKFESAIIEAFESNIPLGSNYNLLDNILTEKELSEVISEQLTLMFENIK